MGRRGSYNFGPSAEELAAARAEDDAHYRRGLIQVILLIVISLLCSVSMWYMYPDSLPWWQIPCVAVLVALAIVRGVMRLIRWLHG